MLVIVYDSLTGMSKRVAQKLGYEYFDINSYTPQTVGEKVFLLTRSFNFGEIPHPTLNFLQQYANSVVGVAVTGNKNWGENFGAAGDKINALYNIPLVRKYEGLGFPEDIEFMKTWLNNYTKQNS
jgi:ribonucleoside-diphosphate reductase protein NrdI